MNELTGAAKYGNRYWAIITKERTYMVYADSIDVLPDGSLVTRNHSKDNEFIGMGFSKGEWLRFFSACMVEGAPVIVDGIYPGEEG